MFSKLWSREARFKERKAYREALEKARREILIAKETTEQINNAWMQWWGSFHALQAYAKHLEKHIQTLEEALRSK